MMNHIYINNFSKHKSGESRGIKYLKETIINAAGVAIRKICKSTTNITQNIQTTLLYNLGIIPTMLL